MYSNPKLPEGINTSQENPLKEFTILLAGALMLVLGLTLFLGLAGSWLAGKIPFSAEVSIASHYLDTLTERHRSSDYSLPKTQAPQQPTPVLLENYLQQLADRIAHSQGLTAPMKIQVHYLQDDTVNAFATLGGHVLLYRGLLEQLDSENTLAMLLAHEIAHVKYRHPIKSLGRGIAAGIAIAAISGSSGSNLLGETGLLTTLHFSREMETRCDETALETLHTLYGHVGGGVELFRKIQLMRQNEKQHEIAAFFSTHPLDRSRIEHALDYARQNDWATNGQLTPLPDFYFTRPLHESMAKETAEALLIELSVLNNKTVRSLK